MPEHAAAPAERTKAAGFVRVVRVLLLATAYLHAALVCAQPFLAGLSLDGTAAALDLHGINGTIIVTVSMVIVPLAVLAWRPGHGSIWTPVLAVALFTGESVQLGLGYAFQLGAHVPLGVAIVVAALTLCVTATRAGPVTRGGPVPRAADRHTPTARTAPTTSTAAADSGTAG